MLHTLHLHNVTCPLQWKENWEKKSKFDREVASVRQWIPMIPSARFNISNILHSYFISITIPIRLSMSILGLMKRNNRFFISLSQITREIKYHTDLEDKKWIHLRFLTIGGFSVVLFPSKCRYICMKPLGLMRVGFELAAAQASLRWSLDFPPRGTRWPRCPHCGGVGCAWGEKGRGYFDNLSLGIF